MKPKLVAVPVLAGLVLMVAGCMMTGGDEASPASGTGTSMASTPAATTDASSTTVPSTATTPPASWVMPNLVGQNLQVAQDAVQGLTANPLFITTSTDATGQGRAQVLDSNWKVCAQNIRPGEMITIESQIEFAAVKLEERCP
jgi:hypothetical protein